MALPTCTPSAVPPECAISTLREQRIPACRYPRVYLNKRLAGGRQSRLRGADPAQSRSSARRCRQTAGAQTQPGLCLLCRVLLKHVAIEIPKPHILKYSSPQPRFPPKEQKSRQRRESIWHPLVALLLPAAMGERGTQPKEGSDLGGLMPGLVADTRVSSRSCLLEVCTTESGMRNQ